MQKLSAFMEEVSSTFVSGLDVLLNSSSPLKKIECDTGETETAFMYVQSVKVVLEFSKTRFQTRE